MIKLFLCLLAASTTTAAGAAPDQAAELQRMAERGDYQAQRNLAYSYQTAALGLPKDFQRACMWRTVIVRSGDVQVDSSDTSNLDYACGKLSPPERTASTRKGEELANTIYRKK